MTQFDVSDDQKKALERKKSDLEAAIASTEEAIATTTDEIAALTAAIKELDKSVAEATEQRKEENEDYKELMASDSAAKELPAEDRIMVNEGVTMAPTTPPGGISGTGVTVF